MGNWTEESTAKFRELYEQGASHGDIAFELGISRNASIGKAHRLGLESRRDVRNRAGRKVGAKDKKPRQRRFVLDRERFLKDIAEPAFDVPAELPPALPPITAVFFHELEPHHCRFPYGDNPNMLFCGAARLEPHSYCARHCRLAYRLPTRRDAPPRTDHPWKDKGIAA